ncbi:MAG: glycosyltransferase family A protein [Dehalococcoidales bacterium]|nr:glycosyltransferase family A protein [Dehalococcoidales bacterium]
MPKITVLTITWKPGYIDTMVDALKAQTFHDFEWVLVDDLYGLRKDMVKELVGGAFQFTHLPPRWISEYSQTAVANNTGLTHSRGELIYFMADYIYPHPKCLWRHWQIYEKYGPDLMISGPILDRLTAAGRSTWTGAPPVTITVRAGDEVFTYDESTPPLDIDITEGYDKPSDTNLLSIWKQPFHPRWPTTYPPDWRLGWIMNRKLEEGLYENLSGAKWWWGGRNDSVSLELLLDVNGLQEDIDARHTGLEAEMAERIEGLGVRYMVDTQAPVFLLPHPIRKKEMHIIAEDELSRRKRIERIPNDYSLREVRRKILKL